MSNTNDNCDEVPRKRRRIAADVQDLLDDIFMDTTEKRRAEVHHNSDNDCEGIAGKIKSVRLQNFMCHSNLEFPFGEKMNFISGKNGSGKSAILTALVIGLGGRTADTNRGQSLKNLIQHGKNKATIEITINNTGPLSYKPYKYGDVIRVVRNITGSSSQYRILSSKGELISSKRDELDLINMYFNIQVNNPVTVLNQDTARTFLKTAADRDLYHIFTRGTHLEEIEQRNLSLRNEKLPALEKLIEDKRIALQEAYQDVTEYNEKLRKFEELEKYGQQAKVLQGELYWAYVYKIEEKYNAQKSIESEYEKKLPQIKEKVEKRDKIEQDLKDKQKDAEIKLKELKRKLREIESESIQIEQSMKSSKDQISVKTGEIGRVKKKIVAEKNSCDEIQKEIGNHESRTAEIEAQKVRIESQKQEWERKKEEFKAVISTTLVHRQHLNDTLSNALNNLNQRQEYHKNLKQKLFYKEEYLKGLKTETNQLMVYSKWMPQLVDNIEKMYKARKFKEKPRGPLGTFIQLKEKSWGPAIESFIGSKTLASFCVDNTQDYKVLKSLIDRLNIPSKLRPSITISKFFNQVHDVRRNETGDGKYINLLKAIKITDPVVANALIDSIEPESVLLTPTSEEAYRLLEEASNVPVNCKRAFTKNGDLFYPAPNYRSYAGSVAEGTRYLQVSRDEAVKLAEREVSNIKQELLDVEDSLSKAQTEKRQAKEKLEQVIQEVHKLNSDISTCDNKLDALKREEVPDTYDFKLLRDDLEYRMKTLKTCEETLEVLESDRNNLISEYKEKKVKYDAVQSTKGEQNEELIKIEAEISELKSEYYKITANRDHYATLLKTEEAKLQNLKRILADLEKEVEKAEKVAKDANADRVPQTREIEALEKDLSKINSMMKALENVVGDVMSSRAPADYRQRVEQLKYKHETLVELTQAANSLKTVISTLEDNYKKVKDLVCVNTKYSFLSMLNKKNFKGDLVIDHDKKLLKIIIKVESAAKDGSATLTLSGGERSYSMVSFIMALWSNMYSPFFFLDEFDVFMDEINRNIIMDMLLSYARGKPEQQFVFLTPHANLPSELLAEVHFFRMSDPRSQDRTE